MTPPSTPPPSRPPPRCDWCAGLDLGRRAARFEVGPFTHRVTAGGGAITWPGGWWIACARCAGFVRARAWARLLDALPGPARLRGDLALLWAALPLSGQEESLWPSR